ncbi:putative ArsR family transcriptional regulator [Gordonia effusa NBRC 100432]|uniref:Putative ArsR family transcriptional regulator n=1 Tax=Gordonia effusa NBRC 100432 TaxID=1077974 RepID=H0QXM0_9ACTN|nr:helix-turn-helix domain-containing protein [Gordonia effusa]GAB17571.1 putative ArsR family transcriptional regulator [Gordonia effusa NBRC 100432]
MPRIVPQPTVDSLDLTTVLAALADPVRLSLMRAIYQGVEPIDCSVVAGAVDLTPATVSHHWRVLREAGLTTTTIVGRTRRIEIRRDDLEVRFPGLLDAILLPTEISARTAAAPTGEVVEISH